MSTGVVVAPSSVPLTLPQPDPLASLIDFGNLHKVLAYILENLRGHNERLIKLETNVNALNTSTSNLNDGLNNLRQLVLNLKPGHDQVDLEELKEKINVVSGRVDNQTREIGSLAQQAKEHTSQIDVLESSTQVLQNLMPTKADVSDLLLKANKTVVERQGREIEELQGLVKQDHEGRIRVLEAGMKRIQQSVDSLLNDDFKNEALRRLAELEAQVKSLMEQANEHASRLDGLASEMELKAAKEYVDAELEALLAKLRELELALAASMKGELKRFERDVMIYVADQLANLQPSGGSGGGGGGGGAGGANNSNSGFHTHNHGNNTAAGRMHFRCLTCDQPKDNMPGPATFRYSKGMGNANTTSTISSESRFLELQMGDQIYLHGTDGGIYKGRSDPVPLLPAVENQLRLTSPSTQVTARGSSPERRRSGPNSAANSRPQSADPSRASFGRQQIDPNSGRQSRELFSLPLNGLDETKEQQDVGGGGTNRNLFPAPSKSARITSGQTRAGLLKSNSKDQLIGGKPPSRPATATSRTLAPSDHLSLSTSDPATGDRVFQTRQPTHAETARTTSTITRNGVEIIQDLDEFNGQ